MSRKFAGRWAAGMAVVAGVVGLWALPSGAYASTANNITITNISPNPEVAGSTVSWTSDATNTTLPPPNGVSGDNVTFTSEVGSTTDNGDGTYTATVQTSAAAGSMQITATDNSALPSPISASANVTLTPGPPTTVTLAALSPASIVANGSSSSTATATVTDSNGNGISGQPVDFAVASGTPVTFSASSCTTNSNGSCHVSITGNQVGSTVIQAADGTIGSNTQTLTETAGPPASVTLSLNPPTILGDGSSTSTATATVTDAQSHPLSGQTVSFGQSGAPVSFSSSSCSTNSSGQCGITITSSLVRSTSTTTITANDSGRAATPQTLTQSATPSSTLLVVSSTSVVTNQAVTMVGTVSSGATEPVAGTLTFENNGAPIGGCSGLAVSQANPSASCVTSFAAAGSPAQVTAVFLPSPGSKAPASSSGALSIAVAKDSSTVSVQVPSAANAGQSVTYSAIVAPPSSRPGPYEPTGAVAFRDNGQPIPGCTSSAIVGATATCTVTAQGPGVHSISASYGGDASFNGSSSQDAQTTVLAVTPGHPTIKGRLRPSLRWAFFYTPSYTRVILLLVNAGVGDTVVIKCHGHGCPFAKHVQIVPKGKRCAKKSKHKCVTAHVADLSSPFKGHHLHVGTTLVVEVEKTGWIGRYFQFTIRSGHGPRSYNTCLAPGAPRPGVNCKV